ncbi:MAG TPA: Dabb family protein [Bacteroidetes bacterium]|nr:MAG: Dabb family protein [Bacteroidota bacterium]HHL57974.1 Dabb family protein [Bacteroidota bacterium]
MLRHIVLFKFSDSSDKDEVAAHLKNLLDNLLDKIPELKGMEVGLNISTRPSAFDIVLTADFDDENGLNAYRVHPEHKKVLDYLEGKTEKSAVVDYFI